MGFLPDIGTGSNSSLDSILNQTPIGALKAQSLSGNSSINGLLPWESSSVTSRFFTSISIDGRRWDQLFPYRLVVIDTLSKNKIVNGAAPSTVTTTVTPGTSSAIVNFEFFDNQWVFQLPISPNQLSIQDQFAINTTATLRGILEEHSGVRFKMVNASGTMGVWPNRPSVTSPPTSPSVLGSLFAGTLSAVDGLVSQATGFINTITTGHPNSAAAAVRPEQTAAGYTSTGLYQAQQLQQFLEQYAEAKRNPDNAGWRLVFDIPKQNQSYIVTPMVFNWIQNANKPMEINYTFQLKAWRRIDLQETPQTVPSSIQPISPGILANILNSISQARNVASSALNLIGAVRSDVEAPLTALRQTALLVKDLAGVAITAADLPGQIISDYSSAIKSALNTIAQAGSSVSTDPAVASAMSSIKTSSNQLEGLSMSAVAGGQLGSSATQGQSIDPANNVFANSDANFTLFDQVDVNSLTLTPAQQLAVDNIVQGARELTVADLKGFRATIQGLALQLSNNFGAGDAFYSKVYNQPAPSSRIQPMTLDEYDILRSLYDVMQSYDILTATTDIDFLNKQTNMDYVAGLASASGIGFDTSTSKILAPVPFGLTVEAIAARYLGDPQRWLEIVTLNNLRDPYIDENGFQLPLLSNASGRQITIGSITNLFIGQNVIMQSSTQQQSARQILGIDTLSSSSFLITLSGLANLDNFITADGALMQAYLPGTANSQQKIWIPSDLPIPTDPNIVPPASTSSDPLTGMSKVDLLLTDAGDLAINNFGDLRFASGMTNIIQAVKLKMGTVKGSILLHPEFGLGLVPGVINAEISLPETFKSLNQMIKQDPRFLGIQSLQIAINGPTLAVNMSLTLAGQQGVFPLNFNLTS